MKLNQVKMKVLEGADAATLQTAIDAFLTDTSTAISEATFISVEYSTAAGSFSALIVYAT